MTMSKVFAIYPLDKGEGSSTNFLNRINTFEKKMIGDDWHCFKVHFSKKEHQRCLTQSIESRFIMFMGHGGSTRLSGACARYGEDESVYGADIPKDSDEYLQAHEIDVNLFYNCQSFINSSNISNFKDKIFFCFSCDSNNDSPDSLSRAAIDAGVLAFVGFGYIPANYLKKYNFPMRCVAIFKGIIVKVMKYAIYYAYLNNETIDTLVQIIRILIFKEIRRLENQMSKSLYRKLVIEELVKFMNNIKIFGNPYIKMY